MLQGRNMDGDGQRNCVEMCVCARCLMMASAEDTGDAGLDENRFIDRDRSSTILAGLTSMYRDKLFVDVTLTAGNRDFACHRNVLAISSPFFAAMFESNMAEKNQTKVLYCVEFTVL
jgi:BTB/POZ domain